MRLALLVTFFLVSCATVPVPTVKKHVVNACVTDAAAKGMWCSSPERNAKNFRDITESDNYVCFAPDDAEFIIIK